MTCNVGTVDRAVRILVALVFFSLSFFLWEGTMRLIGVALGAVAFLTGIFRFCPLWKVVGINTSEPVKER